MKRGRTARRLSATHSTIVAYLALAVALSGTAVAATGGNLILGQSNHASGPTTLATSRGPAFDLRTGDRAPFRVDSSAKVGNLNADAVDGISSEDLQRRVTGTCSDGQFLTGVDPAGTVGCGTPADPLNGLTVAELQKRLSGACTGGQFLTGVDAAGAVACGTPADPLSGLTVSDLQKKVTGTCSGGQFLTGVDETGTVACGSPADPLSGLTVSDLQKKVSGACSGGQFLTGIDPAGTVACGTPADPLNGLTASALQKRVTGTCYPGKFVTNVDASGAITCASPILGIYEAAAPAVDVHPGAAAFAYAWCEAGDEVTGGGFVLQPTDGPIAPQISSSGPVLNAGMPGGDSPPPDPAYKGRNGWVVTALTTSDNSGQRVIPFALCAHLGPLNYTGPPN